MSLRHVTLHQLRIFTVLARHLNMTRAARELHQTPAALSIQIKQLAEYAGAPLYEQVGKKLFLTASGEAVERAGRDILRRLESLTQELDAHRNVERGLLRLAIITTAEYFAPRLVGAFCQEYPGIEVRLEIVNRDSILERLKQNLDDLYIMGQVPEGFPGTAYPFLDNPIVLIAPADHPLTRASAIAPDLSFSLSLPLSLYSSLFLTFSSPSHSRYHLISRFVSLLLISHRRAWVSSWVRGSADSRASKIRLSLLNNVDTIGLLRSWFRC
jgi:DNA-binding transcriptional LysR family regulator